MTFIKPNARPECIDLRLISQRIADPENPKRSYVDTHLHCRYFNRRIKKTDCILCEQYKALTR